MPRKMGLWTQVVQNRTTIPILLASPLAGLRPPSLLRADSGRPAGSQQRDWSVARPEGARRPAHGSGSGRRAERAVTLARSRVAERRSEARRYCASSTTCR